MNKKFLLIFALSSMMANAQYEGFNYTGAITDNGWANATGGENMIAVADGLTYPQLNVVGGKVQLATTKVSPANHLANLAFSTPATSAAYASFLLKVTDVSAVRGNTEIYAPNYFLYFSPNSGESLGSSAVSRLGVRKGTQDGTFNLGFINTGGGSNTPSNIFGSNPVDYKIGETYFVVLKYDMTGTSGETSIWVDTVSATETTPLHKDNVGTSRKLEKVSSLVLRQTKTLMPSVEIDEIRMGSTWAEVMPTALLSTSDNKIEDKKLISNTLVKEGFKVLENAKIEIYSTLGVLVKSGNYNANQEVNLNNLSQGVYFVKITTKETSKVVKIIKQ